LLGVAAPAVLVWSRRLRLLEGGGRRIWAAGHAV